jgi:acetylornithine aminotransferase
MGNGFPVGGLLIAPAFKATHGMLGTTFGGNYLACAASLAVLEVMEQEELVKNAREVGQFLLDALKAIPGIREVRGRGLMIGLEFTQEVAPLRQVLRDKYHIFTGVSGTQVIRLLPPLILQREQAQYFIDSLKAVLFTP